MDMGMIFQAGFNATTSRVRRWSGVGSKNWLTKQGARFIKSSMGSYLTTSLSNSNRRPYKWLLRKSYAVIRDVFTVNSALNIKISRGFVPKVAFVSIVRCLYQKSNSGYSPDIFSFV
jgi:hypothetical protein